MNTIEELTAEIERLKTRVKITRWQKPGSSVLVLQGSRESTIKEAREYFDEDESSREFLSGRESTMTNAEIETLAEFES